MDNSGQQVREVPACLSLFRIQNDGSLHFVRKYDVEVGSHTLFWMGMVLPGLADRTARPAT